MDRDSKENKDIEETKGDDPPKQVPLSDEYVDDPCDEGIAFTDDITEVILNDNKEVKEVYDDSKH